MQGQSQFPKGPSNTFQDKDLFAGNTDCPADVHQNMSKNIDIDHRNHIIKLHFVFKGKIKNDKSNARQYKSAVTNKATRELVQVLPKTWSKEKVFT